MPIASPCRPVCGRRGGECNAWFQGRLCGRGAAAYSMPPFTEMTWRVT